MKIVVLSCALIIALCLAGAASVAPTLPPQRVELKVLKVFSADDGPYVFRAYVVEWNGQEVVVADPLSKTKYRSDDMITVLVTRHSYPQEKEAYGLMHFTVAQPRPR